MTVEDWLASSCADADRRGLPELKPLLAALANATRALRAVDWDGLLTAAPLTWPSATRGLPALSAAEGKTPGNEENPDADRRAAPPACDDSSSTTAHAPPPGDGAIR
jgi:hypothetical protein